MSLRAVWRPRSRTPALTLAVASRMRKFGSLATNLAWNLRERPQLPNNIKTDTHGMSADLRFPRCTAPRTPQIKLLMQSERNMFTEKVVGGVVFGFSAIIILEPLRPPNQHAIPLNVHNLDDGLCFNLMCTHNSGAIFSHPLVLIAHTWIGLMNDLDMLIRPRSSCAESGFQTAKQRRL